MMGIGVFSFMKECIAINLSPGVAVVKKIHVKQNDPRRSVSADGILNLDLNLDRHWLIVTPRRPNRSCTKKDHLLIGRRNINLLLRR